MTARGGPPEEVTQYPTDPGNPYAGALELPAALTGQKVQTTNGPRLLVTIRSGGATLTVVVTREDALRWGKMIAGMAMRLSPLIVPSSGLELQQNGGAPG